MNGFEYFIADELVEVSYKSNSKVSTKNTTKLNRQMNRVSKILGKFKLMNESEREGETMRERKREDGLG